MRCVRPVSRSLSSFLTKYPTLLYSSGVISQNYNHNNYIVFNNVVPNGQYNQHSQYSQYSRHAREQTRAPVHYSDSQIQVPDRISKVRDLFQEDVTNTSLLDVYHFTRIIRELGLKGLTDEAMGVVEYVETKRNTTTEFSDVYFGTVFEVLSKINPKEAAPFIEKYLNEMKSLDITPSYNTNYILLQHYIKAVNIPMIHKIFENLREQDILTPDIFGQVFSATAEVNHPDLAMVFYVMYKQYFPDVPMAPDFVYFLYVNFFNANATDQIDELNEYVKSMERTPYLESRLNDLLNPTMDKGDTSIFKRIHNVLEKELGIPIEPIRLAKILTEKVHSRDISTKDYLVTALLNKFDELNLECFNAIFLTYLVSYRVSNNDKFMTNALNLLKLIKRKKSGSTLPCDNNTAVYLLQFWLPDVSAVGEVFELTNLGLQPDKYILELFIKHYSELGAFEKCKTLLFETAPNVWKLPYLHRPFEEFAKELFVQDRPNLAEELYRQILTLPNFAPNDFILLHYTSFWHKRSNAQFTYWQGERSKYGKQKYPQRNKR